MDEKVLKLRNATRALVRHLDEAPAYDKMADCGCGGVDPYRSDAFEALIQAVKEALAQLEGERPPAEAASPEAAAPTRPACAIRQPT
jgi:hypothetical protein